MANRIYRIFWVFFLAVSGVFLLSLQNERPTDSYHVFLDLTKSNGAVHFESSEAEEDTLSFSPPSSSGPAHPGCQRPAAVRNMGGRKENPCA